VSVVITEEYKMMRLQEFIDFEDVIKDVLREVVLDETLEENRFYLACLDLFEDLVVGNKFLNELGLIVVLDEFASGVDDLWPIL
jgi:hypothetical protein